MVFSGLMGHSIGRVGIHSIKSSLHWESGYLLKFILRTGILSMWWSIIITQGSSSLGEGPMYLWVEVSSKVILARL